MSKLHDPNAPKLPTHFLDDAANAGTVGRWELAVNCVRAVSECSYLNGYDVWTNHRMVLDHLVIDLKGPADVPLDLVDFFSRKVAALLDEFAAKRFIAHGFHLVKVVGYRASNSPGRIYPSSVSCDMPPPPEIGHRASNVIYPPPPVEVVTRCRYGEQAPCARVLDLRPAESEPKALGYDFAEARASVVDVLASWKQPEPRSIPDTRRDPVSGICNSVTSDAADPTFDGGQR